MPPITVENLKTRGYRHCTPKHNYSNDGYQKRIDVDGKELYFINFYRYELEFGETFSAEFQMYPQGEKWVDVVLSRFKTIEEVEEFCAKFYKDNNCVAYEDK